MCCHPLPTCQVDTAEAILSIHKKRMTDSLDKVANKVRVRPDQKHDQLKSRVSKVFSINRLSRLPLGNINSESEATSSNTAPKDRNESVAESTSSVFLPGTGRTAEGSESYSNFMTAKIREED